MIEKKHNKTTKQFLQKILLFIDTTIVNLAAANSEDSDRILVGALTNIKDAIFSEIIRDSQIEDLNQLLQAQQEKKKQLDERDQKNVGVDLDDIVEINTKKF